MAYRADDRCRKSGPVGNGASRGYGRYGEPGYFDDYGYFNPDPEPVDDSYEREQRAKREEVRAELRQRKLEDEAEQRRREVQSRSAPQPNRTPTWGRCPLWQASLSASPRQRLPGRDGEAGPRPPLPRYRYSPSPNPGSPKPALPPSGIPWAHCCSLLSSSSWVSQGCWPFLAKSPGPGFSSPWVWDFWSLSCLASWPQ